MVIKSDELRAQVTDWLNSKKEDFKVGLHLMLQTGYKPNVYKLLLRQGDTVFAKSKLRNELSGYLRFYRNPTAPAHEDIAPEPDPNKTKEEAYQRLRDDESSEYPDIVKRAFYEFSDLYKQRSILHTELKGVGEANDTESMNTRKRIKLTIEAISRRMDDLWFAVDQYKKNETLPSEELFEKPFDPEEDLDSEDDSKEPFSIPSDPTLLKTLKRNLQSKLTRHSNKLEYQAWKTGETPNPMPAGEKRAKTEAYIAEIKLQIEMVQAELDKAQ